MPEMTPLEERRQRSMEAWRDGQADPYDASYTAVEEAIETATRVQITPEAWDALYQTYDQHDPHSKALEAAFTAAVRVLGFEVEGVQE